MDMRTRPLLSLLPALLFLSLAGTSCRPAENDSLKATDTSNPVIASGISNQQVNTFAEDAQGHIWIGTFRGLNKHNVHEIHQYFCTDDSLGLPDNHIRDILRDSKGQLWISTVNGLCRYTDRDNFEQIPTNRSSKNGVQLLESTDGSIFLNYITHLSAYNPATRQMECVIPQLEQQVTFNVKCFITPNNELWVVSPRQLSCYDSSTFQLKEALTLKGRPWHFHLQGNGILWLTGQRTIFLFDTRTHRFTDTPEALKQHPFLSQAKITTIHPYNGNSLLMSTSNHGMFCYNYIENTVVH